MLARWWQLNFCTCSQTAGEATAYLDLSYFLFDKREQAQTRTIQLLVQQPPRSSETFPGPPPEASKTKHIGRHAHTLSPTANMFLQEVEGARPFRRCSRPRWGCRGG